MMALREDGIAGIVLMRIKRVNIRGLERKRPAMR